MDIKQLRYYCAIVEAGTITKAAQLLHMTQPPLTAQIQQLEVELNCELFHREGRRLHLTEAGHIFYEKAKNIINMCESAVNEIAYYQSETTETLHLGVVSSVQGYFFMDWLTDFHSLYPNVIYDIYNENTYQLLEHLNSGLLDLAIVRTPFFSGDKDIMVIKKEVLLAIGLPCFFQSADNNWITFEELAQKPLLLYRRWQKILQSQFDFIGCSPKIQCCNDNAQMTLSMAERGMGLGIIPESALLDLEQSKMITRTITKPSLSSEIVLVCRNKALLPHAAHLFWEMMEHNLDLNSSTPSAYLLRDASQLC